MSFIKESEKRPSQTREKNFFVQRQGKQTELSEYFKKYCRPLYGSDARVDDEGNIFFVTWHPISKERLLPTDYVVVSKVNPRADIYAQHSRYQRPREMRINQIKEEGGSVEAAIRGMDHILEGERGKETNQAQGVRQRATELLDLFNLSFARITDEQFESARNETYRLLDRVKFNPVTVVDEEKKRMAEWIARGSFGRDSLSRRNRLIAVGALSAAYRRALERQKGIGEIVGKFIRAREALIFAREFSRTIFEDVSYSLRPEALPAQRLFKYPDKFPDNVGIVRGMLNTLIFQLEQPPVKPYRTVARQAKGILEEVISLLLQDRRQEIVGQGLFASVRELLARELETHK